VGVSHALAMRELAAPVAGFPQEAFPSLYKAKRATRQRPERAFCEMAKSG